eukprot:6946877-Ditylum_brightwellii.AAC.1
MLSHTKAGFRIRKQFVLHLLYIDNLKLYAKNDEELACFDDLVKAFSKDIGMTYGLGMCTVLTLKNGNPITTNILPDIPKFDEQNGYKYLGIAESTDFLTQEVKQFVAKEYIVQIRKILLSRLTGNKMMTAICALAIPV